MAKRTLKPGTMLNPVPAVMVSCGEGDAANIITIGWTGIINSEPPITYVSVRKSRHSHQLISKSGEYVINLTTESLVKETDFCGVKSGRDLDKWAELKLTKVAGDIVKCPMIGESPVNLECRVIEVKEYPTHDMFIGEIVNVHADESLFDEKGRLCLDHAGLISYSHGEYFGLKRTPLGRFGYSIMKPKTRKRYEKELAQKRRNTYRKRKRDK